MITRLLTGSAALMLLSSPLSAQQAPAGDERTITGQVIDVNCYTTKGASGAGHKQCAEACADAGVQLAILGSDGIVYAVVSAAPMTATNPRLRPFAEGKVKVTGTHRFKNGLHTIEVKTIEAAT